MDERKLSCCCQDMGQAEGVVKGDLWQFTCPNPACAYQGKPPAEGGKLWVDQRRGQAKEIRLLRCAHCRKMFSERRGTALEQGEEKVSGTVSSGPRYRYGA